jgi:hypothetical protein
MQMKHQRHFDASETVLREVAQIRKVIVDLDRTVQILDCDVATEEERARVSDRSDPAYPILARALAARRDNLRDTIAALEQRLATIKVPMVEAVALSEAINALKAPGVISEDAFLRSLVAQAALRAGEMHRDLRSAGHPGNMRPESGICHTGSPPQSNSPTTHGREFGELHCKLGHAV